VSDIHKKDTPGHGSELPRVEVEWSIGLSPEEVIELWSVCATIEAILRALAYKNEGFVRDAGLLNSEKVTEEKD